MQRALPLALALTAYAGSEAPSDLVPINGKVVMVDDALPEAEAVAIRGHGHYLSLGR